MDAPIGTNEVVIHGGNSHLHQLWTGPDGVPRAKGLKLRDFAVKPYGCFAFAPAFDIPLIPESEWQSRLDALIQNKALLSDVRMTGAFGGMIPSRDQNGRGYCWCHSGVSAHLLARARMGEPYADLSAYAIGCMVKNFQDEGGWGSEGIEFQASKGCPTSEFWAQQSVSRSNDNPKTWENAALHKYVRWMELDPAKMWEQLVTCLLLGLPCVGDYNWWSHSVDPCDIVSLKPRKARIWNSWGNQWSDNGMGVLDDPKCVPDSAWVAVVMTPSLAMYLPGPKEYSFPWSMVA